MRLRLPRPSLVSMALLAAMGGQVLFWRAAHELRVEEELVPEPPSVAAVHALSLGDAEFLFRHLGLELQNMGDTGGRFTPLYQYDYRKLGGWFAVLDDLDPESDYIATTAGFYYSQSQHVQDTRYVIDFLRRHAERDRVRNWRWLAQAATLARHRLHDVPLALDIARELAAIDDPSVPNWARQMEPFLLAELGDKAAARILFEAILATDPTLTDKERAVMTDYIERRLK